MATKGSVLICILHCATSASSVSLWLSIARENNHRDTEDPEVAQRNPQIRTLPHKRHKSPVNLFVPFCGLIEQSKIDSDSRVDWFYQTHIVDLRIVDVTANFMTDHFGGRVGHENIP